MAGEQQRESAERYLQPLRLLELGVPRVHLIHDPHRPYQRLRVSTTYPFARPPNPK